MEEFLNYLIKLTGNNGEFKYNVNGKPVVDIKDGKVLVDNLTKKEEPVEQDDEDYEFVSITKDITKDPTEERYYIREKANKQPLTIERTIVFDSKDENGNINPGISDQDLAFILLYRNKDDKSKYNAIMEVIKLLQ